MSASMGWEIERLSNLADSIQCGDSATRERKERKNSSGGLVYQVRSEEGG